MVRDHVDILLWVAADFAAKAAQFAFGHVINNAGFVDVFEVYNEGFQGQTTDCVRFLRGNRRTRMGEIFLSKKLYPHPPIPRPNPPWLRISTSPD